MQRLTFIYLATYLLVGGFGFLLMPDLTLRLLLSNGNYGDVMPRLVGVFMVALGGVIVQFLRARDYRYYRYTVVARSFIVISLSVVYSRARDPLLIVLDAIVLVGLLPSIYVVAAERRAIRRSCGVDTVLRGPRSRYSIRRRSRLTATDGMRLCGRVASPGTRGGTALYRLSLSRSDEPLLVPSLPDCREIMIDGQLGLTRV